jgi:hypothetical protein
MSTVYRALPEHHSWFPGLIQLDEPVMRNYSRISTVSSAQNLLSTDAAKPFQGKGMRRRFS